MPTNTEWSWEVRRLEERLEAVTAERDRLLDDRYKLWMLLDDIDTAGDMFKPEINNYFRYIEKKHRERFKVMRDPAADPAIQPPAGGDE